MPVRRGAARLAVAFTLLAGVLFGAATPAVADDDDRVVLRLPDRFAAGGPPGTVTVTVTRRSDGCVSVRTGLAIQLSGLSADQVQVQVSDDGQWRSVSLSGGDGSVVTEHSVPERSRLCRKRSATVRYRVAFLAGAPGGPATLVAAAWTAEGDLMARADGTRTVTGGRSPSPTPSPSESPTPEAPVAESPAAAVPTGAGSTPDGGGGFFSVSTVVMLFGAVMVAIGIGLLVLLARQSRGGRGGPGGSPAGGGSTDATMILPKLPDGRL